MAKRKKVKKSPSRVAAEKETRRIKQFIRRAEKRGYHFNDVELLQIIPQFPGRYTPTYAKKLKAITPERLYQVAYAADPETGEVIGGAEFRKIEKRMTPQERREYREIVSRETPVAVGAGEPPEVKRPIVGLGDILSEQQEKELWADTVIARVKEYLTHIPSKRLADSFLSVLDKWEQRGGKVALAQALSDMPNNVKDYLSNAMFAAYEKSIWFEQDLINYWPASEEEKDEMLDISAEEMEEFEDIT